MVIGTVESNRLDARVRITLLEGRAQKPVWTHEFILADVPLAAIEDMVVDSVSARVTRRPAPVSRTVRLRDKDLDHRFGAAQLLLSEHTLASVESARAELEAIFAIDTAPAVAVALARATALMLERSGLQPPEAPAAALRRIDALVEYALARQQENAGAWTVRAIAARYRDPVRFEGAEAAHRRAIALDARSADAAHEYAVTLTHSGRLNEARLRLRRALDLDPSHPQALALLAEVELRSGRPQLTCAFANAAIAADPFDPRTYGTRALARLRLAQAREAYADAETAMGLTDGAWAEGIRLMVEVAGDNTSLAQSLGRQYAQTFVASRPVLAVVDALSLARAFAALGFDREAEGALLKARPAGQVLRVGLSDTAFNRLRARPALAELFRSIPPLR
jgi:Tfp pilus assembly protein PilF